MVRFLLLQIFIHLFYFHIHGQTCNLDFEDFEGTSNLNPPTGWQRINSYIGTSVPFSGTTHAGFNTLGDIMIVEPLDCPGEICFYWRASGASSDYDIDIDYSEDGGTTWNTVHTISLNGSGSPTTYSQLCVDLPEASYAAPFTGILIRFHQSRRNTGTFYLDDVCVTEGTCVVNATELRFQAFQPSCIQTGTPFIGQVCATDVDGNIDETYTGSITLSKFSGSGALSGTLTQNAVLGCATFNDLQLSAADFYELTADDGTWNTTSNSFEVKATCPTTDTLRVMSYNLLNFSDGRDDCGANTVVPARWDTLAEIVDFVKPDILMVCELQQEFGADSILNRALNIMAGANYQRAAYVANQSPGGTSLNNMIFYNADKLNLYRQSEVLTNVRDIGYYVFWLNDPNLHLTNDTTFLDVYVGHLKAGSADSVARTQAVNFLRAVVDTAAAERNAIFGGDFNFYRSTETGYLNLLSGTYPFVDPVATPGEWTNNATFAPVHTQSTRPVGSSYDCGATGGMDDRFDFILSSGTLMAGSNKISYIPNSYEALGNSGDLFNKAINDPGNTSGLPQNVLDALFYMSDHLPVVMDLAVAFPTPVLNTDLVRFDGDVIGDGNLLQWEINNETASELEMTLEASDDAIHFDAVAQFVNDAKVIRGSYLDKTPLPNLLYYRLQWKDSESTKFSSIRALGRIASSKDLNLRVYPNPTKNILNVEFQLTADYQVANFIVYDLFGRVLFTNSVSGDEGINFNQIDLGGFASGVYVLEIKTEEGRALRSRFVKK